MNETIESVLQYWLEEVGQEKWYEQDAALDEDITSRFESTWQQAANGELIHWMRSARGTLALLIVTDQFSRNMFRGRGTSFGTDNLALSAARHAITRNDDQVFTGPERQFFYLPYMHSESLSHQERAVRLFMLKMPDSKDNLFHARAHRQVIRTFGRFPYRNEALGRVSTPAERRYLEEGAYGSTLRALQDADAA